MDDDQELSWSLFSGSIRVPKFLPNLSRSGAFHPCADEHERESSDGIERGMKLFSLFSISDEQAMWRVQTSDDAEAFAALVERWEGPIQRLCTRMTGDTHRGEDLAQEAFARVFAKRKAWVPSAKFSTFLWRVALNLCYDELRRRERRRESSLEGEFESADPAHVADEITPDISIVRDETAARVRDALMKISETYRSVLVLRHYEDLKFREIADVLGIPEGTVKSRMAEGLSQLARLLEPDESRSHATARPEIRKELLVL
jgi:RNA polymerase sigma-70 factor (ECF subfamily)